MLNWLRALFGQRPPTSQGQIQSHAISASHPYTLRDGRMVPTDQVFDAWTSGDLKRMLDALGTRTNLIVRYFLLMGIVKQTYQLRADPQMRDVCLELLRCT